MVKVLQNDVRKVNFCTEPIRTQDILDAFFPSKEVGGRAAPAVRYDLRTRHSSLWGRDDGYVQGGDEVMEQMGRFVKAHASHGAGRPA